MNFEQNGSCDQKMLLFKYSKDYIFNLICTLVVFWVQCEQEILDQRCDKRVDKMITEGLIEELKSFHLNYNEKRGEELADYSVGIFQSIGFKEFHEYLLLNQEDQNSQKGQEKFSEGKQLMMIATRQYARYDFT